VGETEEGADVLGTTRNYYPKLLPETRNPKPETVALGVGEAAECADVPGARDPKPGTQTPKLTETRNPGRPKPGWARHLPRNHRSNILLHTYTDPPRKRFW